MKYAELAAKTNYSFLEGGSYPEEIVATAKELGYTALAITDRNGVYGIPRAHVAARVVGLPLIVGAEVTLKDAGPCYLLAKSKTGYGNLCELLTEVHCQTEIKEASPLPLPSLIDKREDLILMIPAYSTQEYPVEALKFFFGERLYGLVSAFIDGQDAVRMARAEAFLSQYQLEGIASNEPLFHTASRKPLQDVLTCIRHTCTLKNAGFKLLANAERALKTKVQMDQLFAAHPEWIKNTVKIAEQCHFSLEEIKYRYPSEWLPAGETGDSYLKKLVEIGVKRRYGDDPPVAVGDQIAKELALISELQYADYFLTIWDIVKFARERNILCQGRGSAANSIVCYVLEITAIDPIRMELLFERFISRERKEPPDIDIDFEHERREEVIQYIYERYGRHRAAITAEVICFRRKSSLREVAKVFEIPLSSVEKLLVLTHRESLADVPLTELKALAPEINPEIFQHYYRIANELLAFPRHLGTHVGGFVLCDDSLVRNVPVERAAMEARTVIQWDKNDLDALGFVRVDILGLGILTCIRKCFEEVEKIYGKKYTLATLPAEDSGVYESFCQGDTVGVFQIESRAQMNMLPRLKPRNFFDLVVEISLVRPGPIQGEMVHPYLRRRQGLEKIEYASPELESILRKTYGVPLFQEQIMKMAMAVAGFSAGEADELRRAMGSWRRNGKNRLTKMGQKFCDGLIRRGIAQEYAQKIFSQIEGFAEYGFPESHAASFAILAYASGFLRLYYPDAYVTAILNAQPMGFYQINSLVHDAERHGVTVLGVDIQKSFWDNNLESPNHVRLGFREIKGLAQRVGDAITKARREAPFIDFSDFISRTKASLLPHPLTKRDLFLIAGANGFDGLGWNRRNAWWEIQALDLQDSQVETGKSTELLPPERIWEMIALDYEAQGVSLYAHPMSFFRGELQKNAAIDSRALRPPTSRFLRRQRTVKVAGVVICRQMPPTASGVLFITLEDEFGFINLVIWKKVYEQFKECLITQSFLYCEGFIEKPKDGDVIHVIVEAVKPLLTPKGFNVVSKDFG